MKDLNLLALSVLCSAMAVSVFAATGPCEHKRPSANTKEVACNTCTSSGVSPGTNTTCSYVENTAGALVYCECNPGTNCPADGGGVANQTVKTSSSCICDTSTPKNCIDCQRTTTTMNVSQTLRTNPSCGV